MFDQSMPHQDDSVEQVEAGDEKVDGEGKPEPVKGADGKDAPEKADQKQDKKKSKKGKKGKKRAKSKKKKRDKEAELKEAIKIYEDKELEDME